MTTTPATPTVRDHATADALAAALAAALVRFLETGDPEPGLFAPDVFCDLVLPLWRLQARGVDDAVALRRAGHPWPGRVPRHRVDPTPTGFVLEAEEEWDDGGQRWCCRELFRADVGEAGITELAVYCTGDWDAARVAEHAASVTLLRP
jgi:hypothetical protein